MGLLLLFGGGSAPTPTPTPTPSLTPVYQLWLLDDGYAKLQLLEQWITLRYRVALNRREEATVTLPPGYSKIQYLDVMKRLRIVRDGSIVWGGIFQDEGWAITETAPSGDTVTWVASSTADYLAWRTTPRPAGQDYDSVTDHADDIAKDLVDRAMGPSAAAARQLADVSVAADLHACDSIPVQIVGGTLLDHLTALANGHGFWWRFTPGAAGSTFTTAYPLWGADRTKGNGANEEMVFSLDRRNVLQMSYYRSTVDHANYVYVAGPGEGQDQEMTEVSDATAIAGYKRREVWLQASSASSEAEREALGEAELARRAVYERMDMAAQPGILTPANLGDQVTIFARRYGRTFDFDGVITAITFEVGPDGVEWATPEIAAPWAGVAGS